MTTILVVEDNPSNMELAGDILVSLDFEVDLANNGKEAIKKTEEKVYDLVLMDIGLPDVSGVDVAKQIWKNPDYNGVPVVALTAYTMKGDREKLLADGFVEYIPKPINVKEFIKAMEKYRK